MIDYDTFGRDLTELGHRLRGETGAADWRHLRRLQWAGWLMMAAGLATAWIFPNPLSILLIAEAQIVRFTIGHHVGHGSYETVPGMPAHYARKNFARGARRFLDWLEWWDLDDWRYTHNELHHPHTQSPLDADLMGEESRLHLPMAWRWFLFGFATLTWKFTYYAPRMHRERLVRDSGIPREARYEMEGADLLDGRDPAVRQLWLRDYAPYVAVQFALPVLAALLISPFAALSMAINLVLAELLHNAQTFICIRSSHCAGDIPLFAARYENKTEFFVQSIIGTVNYQAGGDVIDMLHGWTNYQVEHHLWPTMTLLQYQRARPQVAAICARHGIPYRVENVFARYARTGLNFVGAERPAVVDTREFLKAGALPKAQAA
jgi:fatty acid desaturase